jgi:hypothetical protein
VVNEKRKGSNTMLEISHKSSAKGAFLHFAKKVPSPNGNYPEPFSAQAEDI